MHLSDIMTTRVQTVTAQTPAKKARDLMSAHAIHHLIVVDERRRVIGVVTWGDVGARRGESGVGSETPVSDLMAHPVVCAQPDTSVQRAANLLRGRTIGCLPVLDRGQLVGIVTLSDLLELLGRGAIRPNARGERPTLTHRADRVPGVDRVPARKLPKTGRSRI